MQEVITAGTVLYFNEGPKHEIHPRKYTVSRVSIVLTESSVYDCVIYTERTEPFFWFMVKTLLESGDMWFEGNEQFAHQFRLMRLAKSTQQ